MHIEDHTHIPIPCGFAEVDDVKVELTRCGYKYCGVRGVGMSRPAPPEDPVWGGLHRIATTILSLYEQRGMIIDAEAARMSSGDEEVVDNGDG